MSPPRSAPHLLPLLLPLLLLCPRLRSYEAPQVKQDVFAARACAAFLTFTNAAYLSGVTVELPCHCKPQQVHSVVWFVRKHLDDFRETRALSDHHGNKLLDPKRVPHSGSLQSRFSIRLFSLLIFRAGPSDAGVYICGSAHRDFFYGYDLDIQEARMLSVSPRISPDNGNQQHALGPAQNHLQVFTSFRSWSVCDRCGGPGEQVRIGLCYVHSRVLHIRYRRANQTVASCGSGAVPRVLRQLIGSRGGAKLEFRSCSATCPTGAPRSSAVGDLLSFLVSGSTSADIPVFYLNHPADHVLTLGCPDARPNMAVAWDRGSKPIYRSEHATGGTKEAPPPRLQIDTGHHLVFNPAKMEDSAAYTCWLQGRPAAKIHLLVYPSLGRGQSVTSQADFPAAVRTVMTSFAVMTAVFCLLLFVRAARRLRDESEETHLD